jgi:hypothetical protein
MHMLSERTQVLLSKEQRARLERLATERRVSVGSLIREAIDSYTAPRGKPARVALERLAALDAPVSDWERMKDEILRGAGGV